MTQAPTNPTPSPEPKPGDLMDETIHHTSARQRRGLAPARMQLNLTSMIDVIFQLLIYFVVTASFAINEGILTARLPQEGTAQTDTTPEPPKTPLNIILASTGPAGQACRITVEGFPEAPNTFKGLQDLLIAMQFDQQRGRQGMFEPDTPIIIKPDGDVRWQHVVNAFNAAVGARYTNVNFAQAQR